MRPRITRFAFVAAWPVLLMLAGCEEGTLPAGTETGNSAAETTPAEDSGQSGSPPSSRATSEQRTRATASGSDWVEPQAGPAASCPDCGTITAVEPVAAKGEASGLGIVAGGVVGGIVGNQIGGGTGNKIATVAGAVGGAFAGHEVEKYMKTEKYYAVTVKMDSGESRTLKIANGENLSPGQKVRVAGNDIYLQ